MLVAVGSGEGDMGQLQAAGCDCLTGGHEQQPTGLDGCDSVMVPAEASEQVGVGFVGLVQVRDVDGRQCCIDQRVEAVGRGDCAEDGGQWGRIPGPFAFDLEPPTQVRAAGADAQRVRRAAVLGFVNVVAAFVDQPCVVPAEPQVDCGVPRRNGQQAVMVAEGNVELVGLHAAIVRELDADEPLLEHSRDVIARYNDAADRLWVGR
ncbi:hypothetical protein D3C81_1311250 [compost metagenome]